MPENLGDKFAGLPLGLLVCTPIIEVAKGQSELCRVYLDYVYRLAFIERGSDERDENAHVQSDTSGDGWQREYFAAAGSGGRSADLAGTGTGIHDG